MTKENMHPLLSIPQEGDDDLNDMLKMKREKV